MHFEYPRQNPEPNGSTDLEMVVRNRGGGVPNVGRNTAGSGSLVVESPSTTPAIDHQYQRRLLVLRERLRRALYN